MRDLDDYFPFALVGAATAFLLALMILAGVYDLRRLDHRAEALKNGTDPLAVACVFGASDTSREIACSALAARR